MALQPTLAMLSKLLISILNISKFAFVKWIVFFLCSSVTVFGLELTQGQRIYLGNIAYVIDHKVGEGGGVEVYSLHLESDPTQMFAMRSPILKNSDLPTLLNTEVERFQISLAGSTLINKIDPEAKKWKWAPKIFETPLNPYRRIFPTEKILGWDKTHKEVVIIMPLAKSTMKELYKASDRFRDQVQRTTQIYADLLPELKHLMEAGVVHGDIRPENILIDKDGKAGISDFEGTVFQGEKTELRSKHYVGPEYRIKPYLTYAADLYSTAKTLLWALMPADDWKNIGIAHDVFHSVHHYQKLIDYLGKLEKKTTSLDPSETFAYLNMLKFIRYALNPDPIQRITGLQNNVTEFKHLSVPKNLKMRSILTQQSLSMKVFKNWRNATRALSEGYYRLVMPRKGNTIPAAVVSEDDMETIHGVEQVSTDQKILDKLKYNFLSNRFSEISLLNLKSIPIEPAERDLLQRSLRAKDNSERAWAAFRYSSMGETNEEISATLLNESSHYVKPYLLSKVYNFDGENKEAVDKVIHLIAEQIRNGGVSIGLLGILGTANLQLVLDNSESENILLSKNRIARNSFAKFYISQNRNLENVTSALVDACIAGDGEILLEHIAVLEKHIDRNQIENLFKSAIDHFSKGSLHSQQVLGRIQSTPKSFLDYIKAKHPGYQLDEITGNFRYRQTNQKPSTTSVSSCQSFYGK